MATINPDNIRTDIPQQGSGDPQAPVNELSADHRAQNTNIKGEFQAALDDVTALETGKADQSALSAHVGDTGNPHAVTATQANAVPAVGTADGDIIPYDGAGYYKLPVGANGQVLTARPAGGSQAKLAWENVPGGGGGITKGTPFVTGDLMAAESDAGDGSAETVGFAPAVVARLDVAQAFNAQQTIADGNIVIFQQAGGARIGQIQAAATKLNIWGSSDGLASDIPVQLIGSDAEVNGFSILNVGKAATTEVGYRQQIQVESGATFTLDPDTSNLYRATVAGALTITVPSSGDATTFLVTFATAVTSVAFAPSPVVFGNDPGTSTERIACVHWDGTTAFVVWAE